MRFKTAKSKTLCLPIAATAAAAFLAFTHAHSSVPRTASSPMRFFFTPDIKIAPHLPLPPPPFHLLLLYRSHRLPATLRRRFEATHNFNQLRLRHNYIVRLHAFPSKLAPEQQSQNVKLQIQNQSTNCFLSKSTGVFKADLRRSFTLKGFCCSACPSTTIACGHTWLMPTGERGRAAWVN